MVGLIVPLGDDSDCDNTVFGFANSQALRKEKSLNSGLLDQRLAMIWINENVEAFGGNPKQVTLFGQSDGGTSIGLHMTSYGGKGQSKRIGSLAMLTECCRQALLSPWHHAIGIPIRRPWCHRHGQ